MKNHLTYLLVWAMALCLSGCVNQYTHISSYSKSNLSSLPLITIQDPVYPGPTTALEETIIRALKLRLLYTRDQQSDVAPTGSNGWSYKVDYRILSGANFPGTDHSLTVHFNYNGEYSYEALKVHPEAGPVSEIKILAVTPLTAGIPVPDDIELQVEIEGERFCSMSTPSVASINLTPIQASEKLEVKWPWVDCAQEYNVEWHFVDKRSVPSSSWASIDKNYWNQHPLFDPLRGQGVLITTTNNRHEIDLTYPEGWLFVKVRPVDFYPEKMPQERLRREGEWTYEYYTIANGYEKNKNWQFTSTYIEGGNQKTVGNYTDGSGRLRQTVTNLNTQNKILISEPKYDYEGTASLQFLPVPWPSPSLRYKPLLHRNATGGEYLKADFAGIDQIASQASPSFGASQYYSPNNGSNSIHRDYIPDAEGFPFTQTHFDSKGRISRRGGPGPKYQIGSNHETQYFYSSASSMELNRLFGKQIGLAKHYQKQHVVDPNGQVSTTYLDMAGKTIATALAGVPPKYVQPLDYADGEKLTTNLMGNNVIDIPNGTSKTQFTYFNTVPNSPITINYDLQGITNQLGNPFNVCLECKYRLRIEVRGSDCSSAAPVTILGQNSPVTFQTVSQGIILETIIEGNTFDCTSPYQLFDLDIELKLADVGEYTINKTLEVILPSADDVFKLLEKAGAIPDTTEIINRYIDDVDLSPCEPQSDPDVMKEIIEQAADRECDYLRLRMLQQMKPGGARYIPAYAGRSDAWLLDNHPEKCHLEKCSDWSASRTFDIKMATMLDWTEAADVNGNAFTTNFTTPLGSDPAVALLNGCSNYGQQLDSFVNTNLFPFNGTNYIGLANYANAIAHHTLANSPGTSATIAEIKWFVFRGEYMNKKRQLIEAQNENCAPICGYSTDPNAIVKKQNAFDNINSQNDLLNWINQQQSTYIDCNAICEDNLEYWIREIEIACPNLTEAERIDIESELKIFCHDKCDNNQPYGYILQSDWDNHPNLQSVRSYFDADCDTLVHQALVIPSICETYTTPGPPLDSDCFIEIMDDLNLHAFSPCDPYISNSGLKPFTQPITINDYCFKDELGPGNAELQWGDNNGSGYMGIIFPDGSRCEMGLFDAFGNAIITNDISEITLLTSAPNYPGNSALMAPWTYYQTKVEFTDVYCYSTTAYLFMKCSYTNPNFDPIRNQPPIITEICYPDLSLEDLIDPKDDPCESLLIAQAREDALKDWENQVNQLISEFYEADISCLKDPFSETLLLEYDLLEYHYTLYYYDTAGNLISTLPPEAVHPKNDIDPIIDYTADGRYTGIDPLHNEQLRSVYQFNSLNQITEQENPDGGQTIFKYDDKGMLRFSQNAEQVISNQWSYTKYDDQNRIVEVGQYGSWPTLTHSEINDRNFPVDGTFASSTLPHKQELVKTYYDAPAPGGHLRNTNLRNRVSGIITEPLEGYQSVATYYEYDERGNVQKMEQKNGPLPSKYMEYDFDQLSGNVNSLTYQEGEEDSYYYQYDYDADNRLTTAKSSRDGEIFSADAEYIYYDNGPLARVELGNDKVQNLDYYYTLQGWLKGMNTPEIKNQNDPGKDGYLASRRWNARDTVAFNLKYHTGDYKPIGAVPMGVNTNADLSKMSLNGDVLATGLYNGNITSMTTDIPITPDNTQGVNTALQTMAYQYDQLNRIKQATSYEPNNSEKLEKTTNSRYHSSYSYDKLGNLETLKRNGSLGQPIDDFSYEYNENIQGKINNRLQYIKDVEGFQQENDLDNQNPGNFEYDGIGQLTKDEQAHIKKIDWTVSGKVEKITFDGNHPDHIDIISFTYDGTGNRSAKIVDKQGDRTTTYYIRDASGNVLAIYNGTSNTPVSTPHVQPYTGKDVIAKKEQHLYGSSRLGIDTFSAYSQILEPKGYLLNGYQWAQERPTGAPIAQIPTFPTTAEPVTNHNFTNDFKQYEIGNHLGNVLVTVSDLKIGKDDDNDGDVDTYWAKVTSASDYYPFGAGLYGRQLTDGYRYGFNGMGKDNEIKNIEGSSYDFGARIYNPHLGRWISVDPLLEKYKGLSPFNFVGNMPIIAIDPDGERIKIIFSDKSYTRTVKNIIQRKLGDRKKTAIRVNKANEVEFKSNSGAKKAARYADRNINSKNAGKREKAQLILKILDTENDVTITESKFNVVLEVVPDPSAPPPRPKTPLKLHGDDGYIFDDARQRFVEVDPNGSSVTEPARIGEAQSVVLDQSDSRNKKILVNKQLLDEGTEDPNAKGIVKQDIRKKIRKGLKKVIKQ
ncbi:hypothetical protein POV27_15295 [Aureisphaera galaxeae]|uniref:RHS repeat domain-containing protein n=1 Tax=Aureisphaera galaxeae TaxID=1538023 RepID=UPI00235044A4|nr:RHS repeat-associated core domain-containing protein [Aureisphaera galaxeae]MDC8005428.1 hypothetical protein [Aureisphaera galaxeae]